MNYEEKINKYGNYWFKVPLRLVDSVTLSILNRTDLDIKLYKGDCLFKISVGEMVLFKGSPPLHVLKSMITGNSLISMCPTHICREEVENTYKVVISHESPLDIYAGVVIDNMEMDAFMSDMMIYIDDNTESPKPRSKPQPGLFKSPDVQSYTRDDLTKKRKHIKNQDDLANSKRKRDDLNAAILTRNRLDDNERKTKDDKMPLLNGVPSFFQPVKSICLNTEFPKDYNERRIKLKKDLPLFFQEHVKEGLEGVYKDMIKTLPLFRTFLKSTRKDGIDTEFRVFDQRRYVTDFIYYGSVDIFSTTGFRREHIAMAMFNINMSLRPPIIRDAILDHIKTNFESIYKDMKPWDVYNAVNKFIQFEYGDVGEDVPFECKRFTTKFF